MRLHLCQVTFCWFTTHDGEQFKMLHKNDPSFVPSLSGMVPASKSATILCAYIVSYECHLPVLRVNEKKSDKEAKKREKGR